ncbi:putative transcriptional regulator [Opitutaceae bacterium TAV1]|nr:putative transcriptional regulator [Opitutaceae bacterium TAV1]
MINAPTEPRKWRIASQLREARMQQGFSQGQLANIIHEAGLSYFKVTHISRLECGYIDATLTEVRIIATILDVLPDWLIGKAKPAAPPSGSLVASGNGTSPAVSASPGGSAAPHRPSGLAATAAAKPAAPSGSTGPVSGDPDWPDLEILKRGDLSADTFKQRLNDGLARAQTMLHRSGLPAAPWRAWRDFDRQARELLGQLA